MYRRQIRKPIRVSNKNCSFCESKSEPDFRIVSTMEKFTTERGKILGAGRTGICSKHQRALTHAVKKARFMALLPFVVRA